MSFFNWIEDKLDAKTPKIESIGYTEKKFSTENFQSLISALASEPFFKMRSRSDFECVLKVKGKTVGDLSQAKILFGENPKPDMYKNMKSRFRIVLKEDGRLKIESFEHVMALKNEELEVIQKMLSQRLKIFLANIEDGYGI